MSVLSKALLQFFDSGVLDFQSVPIQHDTDFSQMLPKVALRSLDPVGFLSFCKKNDLDMYTLAWLTIEQCKAIIAGVYHRSSANYGSNILSNSTSNVLSGRKSIIMGYDSVELNASNKELYRISLYVDLALLLAGAQSGLFIQLSIGDQDEYHVHLPENLAILIPRLDEWCDAIIFAHRLLAKANTDTWKDPKGYVMEQWQTDFLGVIRTKVHNFIDGITSGASGIPDIVELFEYCLSSKQYHDRMEDHPTNADLEFWQNSINLILSHSGLNFDNRMNQYLKLKKFSENIPSTTHILESLEFELSHKNAASFDGKELEFMFPLGHVVQQSSDTTSNIYTTLKHRKAVREQNMFTNQRHWNRIKNVLNTVLYLKPGLHEALASIESDLYLSPFSELTLSKFTSIISARLDDPTNDLCVEADEISILAKLENIGSMAKKNTQQNYFVEHVSINIPAEYSNMIFGANLTLMLQLLFRFNLVLIVICNGFEALWKRSTISHQSGAAIWFGLNSLFKGIYQIVFVENLSNFFDSSKKFEPESLDVDTWKNYITDSVSRILRGGILTNQKQSYLWAKLFQSALDLLSSIRNDDAPEYLSNLKDSLRDWLVNLRFLSNQADPFADKILSALDCDYIQKNFNE